MGAKLFVGSLFAAAAALLSMESTLAQGTDAKGPKGAELSEKRLNTLMKFAWENVPEKYTPRSGKTIVVDKKKPAAAMVPADVAREVIRVGHRSGHAQRCSLFEEEKANFETMMRREQAAKKWSDQQLLFMQKLHQVTIMLIVGKATFVEHEGEQIISQKEAKTNITAPCTDDQKKDVRDQIKAYIDAGASDKTAPPAKKK
jgi:predicted Rdx family selenoprotein